jgi:hypothetical protein
MTAFNTSKLPLVNSQMHKCTNAQIYKSMATVNLRRLQAGQLEYAFVQALRTFGRYLRACPPKLAHSQSLPSVRYPIGGLKGDSESLVPIYQHVLRLQAGQVSGSKILGNEDHSYHDLEFASWQSDSG